MRRHCHVPARDASVPTWDRRDTSAPIAGPPFTVATRGLAAIMPGWHGMWMGTGMDLYLPDLGHVADAAELIARFGDGAAGEAAVRAGRSRELGNHIYFCRWRQVERLIGVMASPAAMGTVH